MRTKGRAKAVAAYTWLTTAEIAETMQASQQQVINMIRAGEFGAGNVTRWGREYRIRPEALEAYLERHMIDPDLRSDAPAA